IATQTRLEFHGSTSMAFPGIAGRPADTSVQDAPALSERKTRPPGGRVEYTAQIRLALAASTSRSDTTAPARGVVSAASAVQATPFQVVRKIRPSCTPTSTVLMLGMNMALDRAAVGKATR